MLLNFLECFHYKVIHIVMRGMLSRLTTIFFQTYCMIHGIIALVILLHVRKRDNFYVFITETVISAEEEKHIAAVQKAMEERGMLDHTIVHGVFVGPARSDKNSLMERLLGRMPSSAISL